MNDIAELAEQAHSDAARNGRIAREEKAAAIAAEATAELLLKERDQLRVHVERLERILTQNRLWYPRWDQP